MGDAYFEELIKQKGNPLAPLLKVVLIALPVLFGIAGLILFPLFLIPAIALIAADAFLLPQFDLEFEYLYVNGEIDIDKIMSQKKRKRVASLDLRKDMELLCLATSHELDRFSQNVKVKDYSSKMEGDKIFAMIVNAEEKGKEKILFNPTPEMVKEIRRICPQKVKLDWGR